MSFDRNYVPSNPGAFSLPIVASEFLEHALQQRTIIKNFLENGEDIKPKNLIYHKIKKKLKPPNDNYVTENYFIDKLFDNNHLLEVKKHPRTFINGKEKLPIQLSSGGESDIEALISYRMKNNRRFAMRGLDAVTKDFHRDNTDDELPSVAKRKCHKLISGHVEQVMNERTLTSFLRWKKRWCLNVLLCKEIMYQDFVDENESEKKMFRVWEKGAEILSSRMDTNGLNINFIQFVKSLGGDKNNAKIAVKGVENATDDYFDKNPKHKIINREFTDDDRIFDKRCVDKFLKMKPLLSTPVNMSEYKKKLKYYNFHEDFLRRTYPKVNDDLPEDFVVTVSFFRPMMNKWKRPNYPKRIVHFVEEKKYQFRGDNTLLDLRDTILCSWDLVNTKPASNEFLQPEECFGTLIPSSFLFIHDTFYIDLCRPNAKNLAAEYKKFFDKKPHLFVEELKIKSMVDVKLKNLTFRLNTPYVYVHMGGNCEHTFNFNDIRLITSNDYQQLETYPIIRFDLMKIRRCNYCRKPPPCFIILEDNISPKLPALCCQFCFDYLFADKEGIKKENVIAYHYVDKLHHQC
uniref:snRNA-activating protein complex subunit 3 n=1 Tax=Strongyloides venezuelensis TaxID=75913 RepID=A0A0K0F096_STRVS